MARVAQFDAAARQAGIHALSDVSSFPVLAAAVLAEMARTMTIDTVTGGIAPSPHAGVGLNVLPPCRPHSPPHSEHSDLWRGMFIAAQGHRDGQRVTRSWHMLAEGADGPLIPSMAVALLIGQARTGKPSGPGARSGVGALTLAD